MVRESNKKKNLVASLCIYFIAHKANTLVDNSNDNLRVCMHVITIQVHLFLQAGQIISTKAEITANHNGWMEYRICPNNDPRTPVTQECLDKYVLQRADGKGTK